MAFTTLDDIVANLTAPRAYHKYIAATEAAGVPHSHFYEKGFPGPASAPSPGINGEALTSGNGFISIPSAVANESIHLASIFGAIASATELSSMILCDRLWQNSGITSATTTEQSITPAALPARDLDGATSGNGVLAALEVSTATTNATAITNTTINYTNSAGTSGRTGTISSFPATAVAGTFVPFELQAGDKGVRSIEGITLGTSYGTGVVHLVLYRPIISIACVAITGGESLDAVQLGFPRIYDNSCLFFVSISSSTGVKRAFAQLVFAQG